MQDVVRVGPVQRDPHERVGLLYDARVDPLQGGAVLHEGCDLLQRGITLPGTLELPEQDITERAPQECPGCVQLLQRKHDRAPEVTTSTEHRGQRALPRATGLHGRTGVRYVVQDEQYLEELLHLLQLLNQLHQLELVRYHRNFQNF